MRITNREPKTWACECGQMNLLTERECVTCGEDKSDAWEPNDRKEHGRS